MAEQIPIVFSGALRKYSYEFISCILFLKEKKALEIKF